MAHIRPFAGVRPVRPASVSAPPYDAVARADADTLPSRPESFLRVTRPDLAAGRRHTLDPDIFDQGARRLREMLARGLLVQDRERSFYLMEQVQRGHRQVGVVAAASLDEYARGLIKRHEQTLARRQDDRTRHVHAVKANTGIVALTYRARGEIDRFVANTMARQPAAEAFTAPDGTAYRLFVVDRPDAVAELQRLFARVPALYIADGHHRTAAAHAYQRQRARESPNPTGDEPYNFFLAALFPHDQLQVLPYDRAVVDLPPAEVRAFGERLGAAFHRRPAPAPEPGARHRFGLYLGGRWWWIEPREPAAAGDPLASLDVVLLQRRILAPLLGVTDPRRDPRLRCVGGFDAAARVAALVDAKGGVGFALEPTSVEEIMAVADAGQMMPPKSTWFEPKVRSGIVVRRIDLDPD